MLMSTDDVREDRIRPKWFRLYIWFNSCQQENYCTF